MKKMLILILLAATVVACNETPCPEKSAEQVALETRVTNLLVDSTALRGELLCLQSRLLANGLSIECVEVPVEKATPDEPAKSTPNKGKASKAKASDASKGAEKQKPVDNAGNQDGKADSQSGGNENNRESSAEQNERASQDEPEKPAPTVYELFYDQGKGYFEFVGQINNLEGGHIPELAMMKGYKFEEVCSNPQKNGHNFVIRGTTPGFTMDNGLTDDGILYVKKKIVDMAYRWKVTSFDLRFTGHWTNVPTQIMSDENGTVYGVNIMYLLK